MKSGSAISEGETKGIIVSGRYHRHPLPVPLFSWCGNWKKSLHHKNSSSVTTMVENVRKQKISYFLFVPHVRYIEEMSLLLKGLDHRIDGVHAEDPMRKEKWKRLERETFRY